MFSCIESWVIFSCIELFIHSLFPHADVIGPDLYFPALRCLFNLFLHADVYWPWLIFSCIEMFIQFVSSCRCLLALSYIFLHWDVYSICFWIAWKITGISYRQLTVRSGRSGPFLGYFWAGPLGGLSSKGPF
jgi:hypothetical protein